MRTSSLMSSQQLVGEDIFN